MDHASTERLRERSIAKRSAWNSIMACPRNDLKHAMIPWSARPAQGRMQIQYYCVCVCSTQQHVSLFGCIQTSAMPHFLWTSPRNHDKPMTKHWIWEYRPGMPISKPSEGSSWATACKPIPSSQQMYDENPGHKSKLSSKRPFIEYLESGRVEIQPRL